MNVTFSEEDFVVLNDEERSLYSASICIEPDLLVSDIAHNRDFLGDLVGASEVLDTLK